MLGPEPRINDPTQGSAMLTGTQARGINDTKYCDVRALTGKGKRDGPTNLLSPRLTYPNTAHSSLFQEQF